MSFHRVLIFIAASLTTAAITTPVFAEDPNLNPGMWETTSTVTIESEQMPIPPRTDTSSECVTEESIADGQAFLEDNDECEFTSKDVRADGMDYAMTCSSRDSGTVNMTANLKFEGDSMSGTINGEIQSPMGVMKMNVEMSGERVGEC